MNRNKAQIDEDMRQEFARRMSSSNLAPEVARQLTNEFADDLASLRRPQPSSKQMAEAAENHYVAGKHASASVERERVYSLAEHERHYAPLNRELHPEDAQHFGWRAENGSVQTYQHSGTHRHIHIDGPSGQFFDQQKNPISQHAALDRAMGPGNHHAPEPVRAQEQVQQKNVEQGMGYGL